MYNIQSAYLSGARKKTRMRDSFHSLTSSLIPSNNKILLTVSFRVSLPEHTGVFFLGAKNVCLILNAIPRSPLFEADKIPNRGIINLLDSALFR